MWFRRFASFWIYPLLSLFFILLCRATGEPGWWVFLPLWLPVGVLIWSLLEYALHRCLFHWQPAEPRLRKALRQLHLEHHGDPRNPAKILVRPSYSIPVSFFFFTLLHVLTASLAVTAGVLIGFWLGFLYYEWVHYRLHMGRADGSLLRHQRRAHFHHHFVNPHQCFGVTSPLWDWVFGTFKNPVDDPARTPYTPR